MLETRASSSLSRRIDLRDQVNPIAVREIGTNHDANVTDLFSHHAYNAVTRDLALQLGNTPYSKEVLEVEIL